MQAVNALAGKGLKLSMYHGMINVYKEAGYTSHDVVARLRGICKQKRIGHTGTLDPDAVGVLPVCLGNGTKLCDLLADRTKEYVALLQLGITTDTQDASGTVLSRKNVEVSPEQVRKAIVSFQGDIEQIPPMYSALKVNGKKLYELAREGKEIERKPRPVTIYEIEVVKEAHPEYTIRVECSKGTYIRTLCHDIGQNLGCGGVMAKLLRTRVGEFRIDQAYTLDQLQNFSEKGMLPSVVIPVEKMFENLPIIYVKEGSQKVLKNGNQLKPEDVKQVKTSMCKEFGEMKEGQEVRVYDHSGTFYGIYRYAKERRLFCPVKLFLPEM